MYRAQLLSLCGLGLFAMSPLVLSLFNTFMGLNFPGFFLCSLSLWKSERSKGLLGKESNVQKKLTPNTLKPRFNRIKKNRERQSVKSTITLWKNVRFGKIHESMSFLYYLQNDHMQPSGQLSKHQLVSVARQTFTSSLLH